ncbi:MAG: TM0996/MTH895 family glutaredoxin-like protein [Pyrinomonadaceae bacterium]|nr:TM0996/MTH895 family glutaredoxin-like protein [Pyrinomonadaceae bacterium]MBP6211909.1 TM0996/MTH895 family glutaredoxin-like protein [Pyrinomonadaceae bacterium]
MKTIKILGTGCAKCKLTEAVIRETLGDMGIDADIEKVEDIHKIMEYDIMSTPAVVVDGVVKMAGKVPSKEDIKAMLA